MTLQEYLHTDRESWGQVAKITCEDGFRISIQASATHYCSPRDDTGPWTSVELGYPSESDPLIFTYAEDIDAPTDTVYGYVPIEIAQQLIDKHGGIQL